MIFNIDQPNPQVNNCIGYPQYFVNNTACCFSRREFCKSDHFAIPYWLARLLRVSRIFSNATSPLSFYPANYSKTHSKPSEQQQRRRRLNHNYFYSTFHHRNRQQLSVNAPTPRHPDTKKSKRQQRACLIRDHFEKIIRLFLLYHFSFTLPKDTRWNLTFDTPRSYRIISSNTVLVPTRLLLVGPFLSKTN